MYAQALRHRHSGIEFLHNEGRHHASPERWSLFVDTSDSFMEVIARFKVNRPQVILEAFEDEVVVVNLETGVYYSLVGSAAELWELISQGRSIAEIVEVVASRHRMDCSSLQPIVERFIWELIEEQLVSPSDATAAEPTSPCESPAPAVGAAFVAPSLEKFTDMTDLIMLDPIHEVDETGWPAPKRAQAPAASGGRA